jgi:hypothetical protein
LKINSASLLLIATLIVVSWLPAFAQTTTTNPSSSITVMTDKPTYSDGDQITLSGTVSAQLNVPISIVVRDPSQNLVELGQVSVNTDNTYSTQMTAGGRLWTATGTYEVDVTYGSKDNTAKTTFEFTGKTLGMTGNRTSGNQTVPEFGSMAFIALTIPMMTLVLFMRKFHFRMR